MPIKNNLKSQKFSRLLVLEDSGNRTYSKKVLWKCLCDCGNTILVISSNLKNGNTRSCGCLQKEQARAKLIKHGNSGTPSYEKALQIRKYNLTLESLGALYAKQNSKCGICDTKEVDLNWTLNIDHDHKTGKVRGLLCSSCNLGIGNFKEDIGRLEKAIEYLKAQ